MSRKTHIDYRVENYDLRVNGVVIDRPFQIRRPMEDGFPSDRHHELVIDDPVIGSFSVTDDAFVLELCDLSLPKEKQEWVSTTVSKLLTLIQSGQRLQ